MPGCATMHRPRPLRRPQPQGQVPRFLRPQGPAPQTSGHPSCPPYSQRARRARAPGQLRLLHRPVMPADLRPRLRVRLARPPPRLLPRPRVERGACSSLAPPQPPQSDARGTCQSARPTFQLRVGRAAPRLPLTFSRPLSRGKERSRSRFGTPHDAFGFPILQGLQGLQGLPRPSALLRCWLLLALLWDRPLRCGYPFPGRPLARQLDRVCRQTPPMWPVQRGSLRNEGPPRQQKPGMLPHPLRRLVPANVGPLQPTTFKSRRLSPTTAPVAPPLRPRVRTDGLSGGTLARRVGGLLQRRSATLSDHEALFFHVRRPRAAQPSEGKAFPSGLGPLQRSR